MSQEYLRSSKSATRKKHSQEQKKLKRKRIKRAKDEGKYTTS